MKQMEKIFELLNSINFFETENGLYKPQAIFFDWENTIVRKKENSAIGYEMIQKEQLVELLYFINKKEIFCGVISNKNNKKLNNEVNHFELRDYFQKIIGEGDCPSKKPMVDPLIYALLKTEIEFGKTIWIIGDSESDMEFANMTLSTGILINSEKKSDCSYFSNKNQTKQFKEDLEVNNFREILEILKTMFDEKFSKDNII